VKDNLRRMRWHHDRMTSIPFTETAEDDMRPHFSQQQQNHNKNIVAHIGDELLRYVSDGVDNMYVKNSTHRKSDNSGCQCNPRLIITALQHQQSRAEASYVVSLLNLFTYS